MLEQTEQGDVPVDVYQKLAGDRILFVSEPLSDMLATDIVATLLLKDAEDPGKEITLFINSHGGDIRNAFMIYDVMQMIESPIKTVCTGAAMDEAAILLAGGAKGHRWATKHAFISVTQLVHDYHTHTDLTDANKLLNQSKIDNERLFQILAFATGKAVKTLKKDFDRRVFFNANQAVKYGLIDGVVKFNK